MDLGNLLTRSNYKIYILLHRSDFKISATIRPTSGKLSDICETEFNFPFFNALIDSSFPPLIASTDHQLTIESQTPRLAVQLCFEV